jgi:hypothetical protein
MTMEHRHAAVEAELVEIHKLDLRDLRAIWAARIGPVPKHQSVELLRRRLAYALQVNALGGLRLDVRRCLDRFHQAFTANPNFVPLPAGHFAVGTVLTKVWRGKTYKVDVLAEGFEFSGKFHRSLSQIAEEISGSKRSGPSFFGFREVPR